MSFKTRSLAPELMDDHGGDKRLLFRTLGHFKLINALFARNRFFAKTLAAHIGCQGQRVFTIVDVGAGGGDFALRLARQLDRRSIRARIYCIDNDPRAVEYARDRCSGRPEIIVLHESFRHLPALPHSPDYVFSNHLLHHLTDDDGIDLLRIVGASARIGWIVSDLERSAFWHCLFGAFASVFLRDGYTKDDGLLSIRKSFTKKELAHIVEKAAVQAGPRVRAMFPGRLVVESLE